MANRNFPQSRQWGFHLMPVRLDGAITIGSSGAVASFTGLGIAAVTHDGPGVYKIQLQDNYASFLSLNASVIGSVTGSAVDPAGVSVGVLYQITLVGDTDWATAGIPAGITPAVGMVFALAAAPSAGTGRVKAYLPSAIDQVVAAGSQNLGMLNKQPFQALNGGFVTMVCLAASSALTMASYTPAGTNDSATPPIFTGTAHTLTGTIAGSQAATNPASGEVIVFSMLLNNSGVQ